MATPTSLPASFVDNTSLHAASLNDLRGAFRVLQLFCLFLDGQQTSTTTTLVDMTGASVTITPQSTTSKILVISNSHFIASVASCAGQIRFLRGATNIYTEICAYMSGDTGGNFTSIFLDSPNTTSAITYKAQFARFSGSGTLFSNLGGSASAFLVAEISA
jgi:hypothetical protein